MDTKDLFYVFSFDFTSFHGVQKWTYEMTSRFYRIIYLRLLQLSSVRVQPYGTFEICNSISFDNTADKCAE